MLRRGGGLNEPFLYAPSRTTATQTADKKTQIDIRPLSFRHILSLIKWQFCTDLLAPQRRKGQDLYIGIVAYSGQ